MSLTFKSEVMKDDQGRVVYRTFQEGERLHYNLRIWLEGSQEELDQVKEVEYLFHPIFRVRKRSSDNRPLQFSISIWTWGMFLIHTTIRYHNGQVEERPYYLSYELPPDDSTNYVKLV
jgi:transcription initiation factor IIF auxiliary subunit